MRCVVPACSRQIAAGWVTAVEQGARGPATVRAYDLRARRLTNWRVSGPEVTAVHTRRALFISARGSLYRVPRP